MTVWVELCVSEFFDALLTHPQATSPQIDAVRKFWTHARQALGKKVKKPGMCFQGGVLSFTWTLCGVGYLEVEFHNNGDFSWFFKDRVTKNYSGCDPEPLTDSAMKTVCDYLARDPEYASETK